MATFTSVQSGNWADGATWGHVSPGVAGTDYPGITADVAVIAEGHTVTYNLGISVVVFGNVTISGTLTFPTDVDSDITIGSTSTLTVNSTGTLNAGSSVTPIGSAYKCRILFVNPTTTRTSILLNSGATVNMYGSDTYYGGVRQAELDANWTGGQSFIVKGNVTAWPVGSTVCLSKNAGYSSYSTDVQAYTIASRAYDSGTDKTTITISEAAPGLSFFADNYGWKNLVFILSRNVFVGVNSMSATRYANLDFKQVLGTDLIHFTNVQFQTLNTTVALHYNIKYEKCSFIRHYYPGHYNARGVFKDCVIYSAYYGFNSTSNAYVENCYCLGCVTAIYSNIAYNSSVIALSCSTASSRTFRGVLTAVSCDYGVSGASSYFNGEINAYNTSPVFSACAFSAKIYANGCYYISSSAAYGTIYGKILNCTCMVDSGGSVLGVVHFIGEIDLFANAVFTNAHAVLENCIIGTTFRPYTLMTYGGSIVSVYASDAGWQVPPSWNEWALLFTATSSCDYTNPLFLSGIRCNSIWAASTRTNIAFSIYPLGFTTELTEKTLNIEVMYLNATGGYVRVLNTVTATYANGVWSTINIPIAPAKDGLVLWNVSLAAQNGTMILDPIPILS